MDSLPRPKFGIFLPFYNYQNPNAQIMFSQLLQVAQECDRLGYHSVWVDDHLMCRRMPILECWTALSTLAASTSRVRLGTMITCSGFRSPALLAKMGTTVDVVSGGRLELGLGAGIQREEHVAYGFGFPNVETRVQRLNESVEIIKALWTQEKTTYKGKHYSVEGAVCEPKPVQKPHPPITVGGSGEKHLLRVTAMHADRVDFGYLPTLGAYKQKLEALEGHCRLVGRDFDEIEKACWPEGQIVLAKDAAEVEEKIQRLKPVGVGWEAFEKTTFVGTPEQLRARFEPYVGLGVSLFMLFFGDLPSLESLRLFAGML
jgi:F420-dependent oxidoreductase-like protein